MTAEPRTMYAVATGGYSDYRVHGLFEEYPGADAAATRVGGIVQEIPLYAPGDDSLTLRAEHTASVRVSATGKIGKVHHEVLRGRASDGRSTTEIGRSLLSPPTYYVYAVADTKERACKAAGERAAQVAALILDGVDPLEAERGRP